MAENKYQRFCRKDGVANSGHFIAKLTQPILYGLLAATRLAQNPALLPKEGEIALLAGFLDVGLLALLINQIANENKRMGHTGEPRDWTAHVCHAAFIIANIIYTVGLLKEDKMSINTAHIVYAVGYILWAAVEINALKGSRVSAAASSGVVSSSSVYGAVNSGKGEDEDEDEDVEAASGLTSSVPMLASSASWRKPPQREALMHIMTAVGCFLAAFTLILLSYEGIAVTSDTKQFNKKVLHSLATITALAFAVPAYDAGKKIVSSIRGPGRG